MHPECLEVSSALLRWSRRQPRPIAIKAELVAASLELLAKRPDDIPLRHLVAMNGPWLRWYVGEAPSGVTASQMQMRTARRHHRPGNRALGCRPCVDSLSDPICETSSSCCSRQSGCSEPLTLSSPIR